MPHALRNQGVVSARPAVRLFSPSTATPLTSLFSLTLSIDKLSIETKK